MRTRKVLLFVDDDCNMSELYQIHGETAGFETVICLSGEEALTYLDKHEVDIIVMDLAMSPMSGLSTAKQIRQFEQSTMRTPAKMVFMTAYNVTETMEKVGHEVDIELD